MYRGRSGTWHAFLNELLSAECLGLFKEWEARAGLAGKARKWKEARDRGLGLRPDDPE
jgi:hypothetical protein